MLKCFCGEYLRQKGNSLSINRLHGIIRREVQKVSYLLAANKRSSLLKDLPSLGSTIYVDTLFSITIAYYDTGVKGIYYVSNINFKYISIQKGNYHGYIYR